MDLLKCKKNISSFDTGDRVGATSYIDFLRWEEITEPVMKGIDCLGRYFIVIKMKVDNVLIMETYFQRYRSSYNWQACGHATVSLLNTVGKGLNEDQIELLKRIINGETVKLEEKYKVCNELFINKNINLYDEKKEKAVEIIQKYWLRCRYNPKFKMCSKIQMRNLQEIIDSK